MKQLNTLKSKQAQNLKFSFADFFNDYTSRLHAYILTNPSSDIEEVVVKKASGVFFLFYIFNNQENYFSFSPQLASSSFFASELEHLKQTLSANDYQWIEEIIEFSIKHREDINNSDLPSYFLVNFLLSCDGQYWLIARQPSIPQRYYIGASTTPYLQDFLVLDNGRLDFTCYEKPFVCVSKHTDIVLTTPNFKEAWDCCLQNPHRILLQRYREKNINADYSEHSHFLSSFQGIVYNDQLFLIPHPYPNHFDKFSFNICVSNSSDLYRFLGKLASFSNYDYNNPYAVNSIESQYWIEGFFNMS